MGSWSLEADEYLWSVVGEKPRTASGGLSTAAGVGTLVTQLAAHFGRTGGAIRSRLKHLDDPTHRAYQRRHGAGSGPPRTSLPAAAAAAAAPWARHVPVAAAAPHTKRVRLDHPQPAIGTGSSTEKPIQASELSGEQAAAAARVVQGESVFITGAAGTGKSHLLRYIIQELSRLHSTEGAVAVTAPTGIAAVNIGGVTIHSWAGIGLGRGDPAKILARVQKSSKASCNWGLCRILVVDEISMLSSELFDLLDFIGKTVRARSEAFGGIQLVLCGDFAQLPPVTNLSRPYCFQGAAWARSGLETGTITLQHPHRQATDPEFVAMLNELRRGVCSAEISNKLAACHVSVKPKPTDGILPTKLYCTNRDVDAENSQRLAELAGQARAFPAHDTFKGTGSDGKAEEQLRTTLGKKVATELELKVGAQVVLLRNLSQYLANGSRGVVVGFDAAASGGAGSAGYYAALAQPQVGSRALSIQRDLFFRVQSTICTQYAYAVPSQHPSLLSWRVIMMHQMLLPRVQFDCGITQTIETAEFWQGSGGGSLTRWQLPLKLGWALTVHRAQGMTLSRVELQVDGAFGESQFRASAGHNQSFRV